MKFTGKDPNNINQTAKDKVEIFAGGSSIVAVSGSGNVGIGTNTPTATLQVYKSGSTVLSVEGSQGSLMSVDDSLSGSLMSVGNISGLPLFEVFDDGTIVGGPYNQNTLVVTGSRVGIGTATPTQNLHVSGSILIGQYGASESKLKFANVTNEGNSAYIGRTSVSDFEINGGSIGFFRIQIPPGTDTSHLSLYGNGVHTAQFFRNQRTRFGGNVTTNPSSTVEIRGEGTTSSTTALLVQNSAGSTNLQVTDDQVIKGYGSAQLRFQLGNTQSGISTRTGALCVGFIDAGLQSGLQLHALGTGKTYIDGWNDGGALQYDIIVGTQGSRTQFGTDSTSVSSAQVSINSTTRGFLPTRTNLTSNISSPAQGLMTYLTGSDNEGLYLYNSGSTPGWQKVLTNTGSLDILGNVTIHGTASVDVLITNYESSSIIYSSGSTKFGDTMDDTHQFTGSVGITGSLTVFGAPQASSVLINNDTFYGSYNSSGTAVGLLQLTNSNNTVLRAQSGNNVAIQTGGGNSLWVGSDQKVGIGTISPTAKLHVKGEGTTSSTTALRVENSNASTSLTVLDNGFVGINTGSAQYNLDVNGTARVQTTLTAGQNTGTSYNHLFDAGLGGITFRRLDSYVTSNFVTITQPSYSTAANGSMLYIDSPGNTRASGFANLKLVGPYNGGGSTYLQVGNASTVTSTHVSLAKFHTGNLQYIGPTYGGSNTFMGLDIKVEGQTANYSVSTATKFVGIYVQSSFDNAFSATQLPIDSWKTFVDNSTLSNTVTPFTSLDITPTFSNASNAVTSYGININPALNSYTGFVALNVQQGKVVISSPVTASSSLAQGAYFNNTLVASANNDVLVGLDISPNFITGSFTGLSDFGLRISTSTQAGSNGGQIAIKATDGGTGVIGMQGGGWGALGFWGIGRYTTSSTPDLRIFGSTGLVNITTGLLINTTANAGYLLDVNGSVRFKGSGTTSSTTALLVQNSNASASLEVKDDLTTTFGGSITVAKIGNNQLAILDTPSIEYRYNQGGSGGQRINFGFYNTSFNFVPGYETLAGSANLSVRVTGSGATYAFSIINGNNANPETELRNAFDLDGNLYFRNDSTIRTISTTYANGGTLNVQGGQPRSDVPNGNGGTLSLNGGLGLGTGTPGDIILKTSTTGSSGTTLQSLTSRVWIKGQTGNVGIGTSAPSASLHVVGNTILSGSAGTGTALQVYKSGSTVFKVEGSQGELFAITDSLSGSLFSVSNISGLPILEVFSDNTILLGDYQAPALFTTKTVTANSGSTVIYSIPTASYDGAFFEYTIKSGSNARAGSVMGMWAGTDITYTDNSTTDIGSTSGFIFGLILSGSNMVLTGSASTDGWNVKTIIKSI